MIEYYIKGKQTTKEEYDQYMANKYEQYKANNTKRLQIRKFKAKLAATDYKAIKYAEGLITEDDYAPIKAEREALRQKIRELED